MREIKFRFWSGSKMCYDTETVMECLTQQIAFNYNAQGLVAYDHIGLHSSSFMQSTAIREHRGEEVYEGDIIASIYNPKKNIKIITYDLREARFAAENLDNYQCEYLRGKNLQILDASHIWSHFIVIGNIYENPDLLEVNDE